MESQENHHAQDALTCFQRELGKVNNMQGETEEPIKRRESVPATSRLRHPETRTSRVGSKTPEGTSMRPRTRGTENFAPGKRPTTARRRKTSPGSVGPAPGVTPAREEVLERRCRDLRTQAESVREQFEAHQKSIATEKERFLKEQDLWTKEKNQNVREIGNLKRENYSARQEAHESKASLILKNRELLDCQAVLAQSKQQVKELEQVVQLLQQKNQALLVENATLKNATKATTPKATKGGNHNGVEGSQAQDSVGQDSEANDKDADAEVVAVNGRQFVPVMVEEVPALVRLDSVAEEPDKEEAAEQDIARHMEEPRQEPQESSDDNMESQWVFVIQGQNEAGPQEDFERKKHSYCPGDALEKVKERGIVWVCERGRRQDKSVPNQDDFLLALQLIPGARSSSTVDHKLYTQVALYGVFDGHGPNGHKCSDFARTYLPESVFGHKLLFNQPEIALQEAFQTVHKSMLEQSFDCKVSGTTAALAMVMQVPDAKSTSGETQSWLICAHAGDSRLLLASVEADEQGNHRATITQISSDHRPEDEREEARINQSTKGEVRVINSAGKKRVFAKGLQSPALALTRSLGDSGAKDLGVAWEPDVVAYRLRPCDRALILATDGLFEFCTNEEVASVLMSDGMDALPMLCQEARRRWGEHSSNQTVDDITAIAVPLDVS